MKKSNVHEELLTAAKNIIAVINRKEMKEGKVGTDSWFKVQQLRIAVVNAEREVK